MNIDLQPFLTPAIILGILAFFVSFFGKVISDQKPYTDNSNWEVQLQGISFLLIYMVFPAIAGFYLASYFGTLGIPFFIRVFAVLTTVIWTGAISIIIAQKMTGEFRGITHKQKEDFKNKLIEPFKKHGQSDQTIREILEILSALYQLLKMAVVDRKVPLFYIGIFYMWVLISEIQTYISSGLSPESISGLILIGTLVFMGFFTLAHNKSLIISSKYPIVDIYTTDDQTPFTNASLLKVTDTAVKFLSKERILIVLNRSQLKRIERGETKTE